MLKLVFSIVLINIVQSRTICYKEGGYDYGCFTDERPFGNTLQRPLAFLPDKPSRIQTRFTLSNRKTEKIAINATSVFDDHFDSALNTKFIIHGFLHYDNHEWVQKMKDEMLKAEDINVITVDWSKGNGFPYTQATANTQVVGREIAKLINSLCENTGTSAQSFHLVGHSLGGHIAGYAGERLKSVYKKNLGRITGLDPAGPYFENTEPIVRLDPTDADFVDAIHTDGTWTIQLGLGIFQTVGDVDFYPNGGYNQPDCPQTSDKLINGLLSIAALDVSGVEDGLACSHNVAIDIFTDSISKKCKFTSYPCDSKDSFDKGLCLKCTSKGCNSMGYWASPQKGSGKLYLNTQSAVQAPFCMQNYRVTLFSKDEILQTRGKFKAYFVTENHQSKTFILDDNETTFKKDSEFIKLISLEERLDEEIKNIYVSFDKTTSLVSGWLYWDQWSFHNIEIFNGETQVSTNYCPYTPIIQSGSTVRFNKC